jgi:hypothetical protein
MSQDDYFSGLIGKSAAGGSRRTYVGVPLDYYSLLGLTRAASGPDIAAMHAQVTGEEPEAYYGKEIILSRQRVLVHILHELSTPESRSAYDQKLNQIGEGGWPTVTVQAELVSGFLALMIEVRDGWCHVDALLHHGAIRDLWFTNNLLITVTASSASARETVAVKGPTRCLHRIVSYLIASHRIGLHRIATLPSRSIQMLSNGLFERAAR